MHAVDLALHALWARASTLEERLSGAFVPVAGGQADADTRFEAWLALAAEGNPQRLARRLAFDGLDAARVRSMLGCVAVRPGVPLPPEFDVLRDVLAGTAAGAPDEAIDGVLPQLAFGDVLAPFLRVAQRRLDACLGACLGAHDGGADAVQAVERSPAVRLGCLRGLAQRLADQAGPTLGACLQAERAQQLQGCYRRVVDGTTGAAGAAFWHTHAALARALAIAASHWVAASAEMLLRLGADAAALVQTFGPAAAGAPVELDTGLGDPHCGGRTVARLRFASGLQLFYKPRDLSLDLAFAGFLAHMQREGAVDDLRVPTLLQRNGYGWVAGVAAEPAADAAAVERYFERGGALLCVAHLLDITDCHAGNLVAAGEHPVLIDLETVGHQRAPDLDARYSNAELRARQLLAASVLGTGLLPDARMEGGLRIELGGLSTGTQGLQQIEQTRWVDLGTDTMRQVVLQATVGDGAHQLRLHGTLLSVRAHEAALQRGFARMARHAMAHRQAWCRRAGPLAALAACTARFVFRGTLVYGALLQRLTAPDLSFEGVDRSLLLDVLARPLLDSDAAPAAWPLLAAERAALSRLDVPHITSPIAGTALCVDGALQVDGCLQGTGLERMRKRILSFGEADLVRESVFIRTALVRPMAATVAATAAAAEPQGLSAAGLRAEALAVAQQLEATALWGDDGAATWIDAKVDGAVDALAWRSLPPGLGDGVAGVVLFLAALEHAGVGPQVRRLRKGAQKHLAAGLPQLAAEPLGGLVGAPSVAYALAHVSALTGDRSALALAGQVVESIPLAAIAADTVLDVAAGVAGTLLCLAAVRGIAESAGMQQLAQAAGLRVRACAARLADAAAAAPGHLLPTVAGRVLTGLSHGQAGFALAISRLRAGDGAAALQPMARAALDFERAHRVAAQDNWRDLRPGVDVSCSCAWCHGAPGIGLVRAVLRGSGATNPALADDLAMAARSTQAEPDAALDHLCCGNMGLVACTQLLAAALDDPQLAAAGGQRAARVMARAKARGGYSTVAGAPAGVHSLGLFTGLAGVGYALLCLAEPGLPSVLTLA